MQEQASWLVAHRYEVGKMVGRGGYGMVCRGIDRETGRAVALKMLTTDTGRDPNMVERMFREQQALLALRGTCAVTAIDLCRLDSGAPCLVMEWLEGHDLEQRLSDGEAAGELGTVEELLALLAPVAATLERAHDIGLVHRDIKPANIFLTTDPDAPVRLLDFGLSRMKSAAPITAAGMVMGSPSYISPETWAGDSRALDGRADLFSLGVIVFRWLTGKLPFEASDLIGKMTAVTTGPRPSVLALRPDLPTAIDTWMRKALAIQPDARYQTGSDFLAALSAALQSGALPLANAEASGVRKMASDARKGPLRSAWDTATSLLKRFNPLRDAAPSAATLSSATPLNPEAREPPAERLSIWLDSAELEDAESDPTLPVARAAPPLRPRPNSEPPPSQLEKRAVKAAKKPAKAQGKSAKAKTKRRRPKKKGGKRGKKSG